MYQDLITELKAISKEAGNAILEIYNGSGSIGVEQKADNSPITLADKASNEVICNGLKALSKQFPIVSEENKAISFEERRTFEYFWMVDPLDGTKEFINRTGEFTVNIALIHNNQPVLGVVYVPLQDKMYWGATGQGAFLQEGTAPEQQLFVDTFSMDDEQLKVVCSRSHLSDSTKAYLKDLKNPALVAVGSSLKFLLIAEQKAQLYPRLGPTMEWDTAAAQAVLEAAGGAVVQYDTMEPVVYNKENLLNPFFIAQGNIK